MKGKIYKGLLAAALMAAPAYLISCGTGGSETSSANSDTVKTASLKISVPFKKEVKSQFISQNAHCIQYEFYTIDPAYGYWDVIASGVLTPDNPTATLQNLPVAPGGLSLYITDGQPSQDTSGNTYCSGNEIDYMSAYVELAEGQNTFTATLIGNAKWQFVDKNDNPVSITFNKTKSDSQETVDYFLVTKSGIPSSMSLDETKPAYPNWYTFTFRGSNLYVDPNADYYDYCLDNTTCYDEGTYFVQFIGPDQSNNAIDSDGFLLEPKTDSNGNTWRREAFFLGLSPEYENYGYYGYHGYYGTINYNFSATQSDGTDVVDDIKNRFPLTTVISADTIEGTILEVATNTSTEQETAKCYWDEGKTQEFTCPQEIAEMAIKQAVVKKFNELSSGISSQAIDSNNCYTNVSVSETGFVRENTSWYANCDYIDVNGDGNTEYVCDYNLDGQLTADDDTNGDGSFDYNDERDFYVDYSYSATVDICVHTFRAKAGEIPQTDLNLIIQ